MYNYYTDVVIVAKTKKQAGIIFGKIEMIMKDSPNIYREIEDFKNSQNDRQCKFFNLSKITVVICDESGRGERSCFTIGEEFRLMDKEKYDSIVRPFAIARQATYLKNPKYSHLIEEPKEMLITSAYYKNLWWYGELKENIKSMLKGEKAGVIFFDYPVAIKHGIKTKKLILKDKQKMDMISFQQEYQNIPFGENSNAFFKLEMFSKIRNIKKVFYPPRDNTINSKKNTNEIKRKEGEIRIVSVDIATRKGSKNDNTIMTCIRALPTKKGYIREFVYMESHQGEHTEKQALRIKQIYESFTADYISIDLQGAGITVFERLANITKDEERGVEYEPYTVMDHKTLDKSLIEELKEKTLARNAKPIIYPIRANAKLNNDIALDFRDKLQRDMISIPIDTVESEDYLNKTNKEFSETNDISLKMWYIEPYMQFSLLVNETINLSYTILSGNIRLEESSGDMKDRYSSASYGNYFITLLEKELLKQKEDLDWSTMPILATPVTF